MKETLSKFNRSLLAIDSYISTFLFEIGDLIKRGWARYSSFLERFRVRGPKRVFVDLIDDGATFGLIFAVVVIMFALPPFSGTGDIWNRNREYAVSFTDVNGELIGLRGIRQDDAVPLKEIPSHVIKAVLATEDERFYSHFGVDIQGTARAMVANAKAQDVVQGGSTLTQQLAKNLFLSPERTFRRKIHEAFLALWIEARREKDEILKLYLDRSYLGGGNYGVEAASQFYFGKSVRDVTLNEAAILAGLFKAPSKYAPHINLEAAKARANVVLYRMLDAGFISQGELLVSRRTPASVVDQSHYYSPDYFLDWAYQETLEIIKSHNLSGDFVLEVKTTVDLELQKKATEVVNSVLENEAVRYGAQQGALVSMTPQGAIKAIVGGRDYENSQFNRATDALRQPGSAFKPFVYLAALENGFNPNSVVNDRPVSIGNWTPRNYSHRYRGRTTLSNALARSFNTVPVRLMKQIGRKPIIDAAQRMGLQSELRAVPSLPLGTNEVTVLDLTSGYATFANGGRLARPHAVLEIRRPNGELIYERTRNEPDAPQVADAEKIAQLNSMLNKVVTSGTARRANLEFTPQAGKTGTTQNYRDAWFVGYTGHYVTGVWYGNDDYTPTRRATGGSIPALTWKKYMEHAVGSQKPTALAGIPLTDAQQKIASIPGDVGIAAETTTLQLPDTPLDTAEVTVLTSRGNSVNNDTYKVTTNTPSRTDEQVSNAIENVFSIFDRKKPKRRTVKRAKKKKRSLVRKKSRTKRKKRASRNVFRLKDLFKIN